MAIKKFTVRVDEALVRRLKFAALQHNTTVQALTIQSIQTYLAALNRQRKEARQWR